MKTNLTKENFWNDVYSKFPNATKLFCDWIDEYKKKNNWQGLFNGEVEIASYNWREESWSSYGKTNAPKYHNLPYAIQQGIWIEFADEILNEYFEQPEYEPNLDLEEDINCVLDSLEKILAE